jgi:hypothetical protein
MCHLGKTLAYVSPSINRLMGFYTVRFSLFLGCNAVWNHRYIPTFQRNVLSWSSRLLPMNLHSVTTQKNSTDMLLLHVVHMRPLQKEEIHLFRL